MKPFSFLFFSFSFFLIKKGKKREGEGVVRWFDKQSNKKSFIFNMGGSRTWSIRVLTGALLSFEGDLPEIQELQVPSFICRGGRL